MSVNHFSSYSSHPGRRGDERNEGRSAPFERLQIMPLVVGSAGLPAAVDDPDPLEGQRADGGVVALAPALLQIVVGVCPGRVDDGTLCELMEGLAQELRTVPAPMRPAALAAALDYGRDPGIGLHFQGGGMSGSIHTEGAQQPWREGGAGSWQVLEEERIGMLLEQRGDLFFIFDNGTMQRSQLPGQHQDRQPVRLDDCAIPCQRFCGGNGGDHVFDHVGAATVVRIVERADGLWPGALDGFQRGPLQQPIARNRGEKIHSGPLDRLGIIQF